MKKITRAFMILSIIVGILAVTSCNLIDSVKEAIEETYDTWYVYNRELSVPVAGENSSSSDGMLNNAQLYVRFDADDGLEVLVCTTKAQSISYLGGAYEVEANLTTGGKKEYSIQEFGPVKWSALMATGRFEEDDPPKIDIQLDNVLNGQFNLKRLLAQLLLAQLE
ncbi:MAG: hypothetical protein J6X78_01140 [Treponema sp.]|nr:hypothetical protein [Treponema sp.]